MRRGRPVVVIGIVAALGVLVGAGIAWASIPDSSGVIHTCYKQNGWRVVDSGSTSCKAGETPLAIDPGEVRAVIRTATETIAASEGSVRTFTAQCGAGEVATGGGWRLVGSTSIGPPPITVDGSVPVSTSSEPSAGEVPIGWKVIGVVNHDATDHAVTVFAVCAPA